MRLRPRSSRSKSSETICSCLRVGVWGAYGNKPSDEPMPAYNPKAAPSKQFNTVHCAIVSNDGFVYVCDRVNDRIQVFREDGTFVKEAFIDTHTYRSGSVWDMTFSRDPQQTYIYAANGALASTISRPIRKAISTRPKPTPARASSGSCTRA